MNPHVRFFFGLLFPMFIMVGLVRIIMNDMAVWAGIWSVYTLVFTVGLALGGTILETTMKEKPKKKVGEK
jgi:hypothetical protein